MPIVSSDTPLGPVSRLHSLEEFHEFSASAAAISAKRFDESVLVAHVGNETWVYPGYSALGGQYVLFHVDMGGAWQDNGRWIPNIRERLVCPITGLNNRQRLMAMLVKQIAKKVDDCASIYLMEQVTQFYEWCARNVTANVIGSEYLGPEHKSGNKIGGIRHEDIANLSFETGSLDAIISNDVFEHVPYPESSFTECARVLRHGGTMFATIPFSSESAQSVVRAEIIAGEVHHHLSAEYHGNPIDPEGGSLVFTDYGWDILSLAQRAGFSDASVDVYHEPGLGHIGNGGLFVFSFLR